MIHVQDVWHSYTGDDRYSVRDVSFSVAEGEVFGFLGPSGAGKSTTQNLITGLLPMQRGHITVAGYDIRKPHLAMYNQIGVSFELPNLYSKLTALENLQFYRRMFDVPTEEPAALLELVGLSDAANKRIEAFSKGMKQRLNFARSMLNKPPLWFLDEPTSGLDPAIADQIKQIIRARNDAGTTIFLTTHNMGVADELCDRVAFIVDGEIKLIDSPKALKLRYGRHFVDVEYAQDGQLVRANFSLDLPEEREALRQTIAQQDIRTMHTEEATLEQIFINVTGKGLNGDAAE